MSPETLSKIWIIFTFLKIDAFLSISVVLHVTIEKQLNLGHRVSFRKNLGQIFVRGLLRTDFLSVYSFCIVPKHKAVLTELFSNKSYFSLFSTKSRLYSQLL